MKELDVAIKAVKESGKIIMEHFKKGFKTYRKPDKSPVTDADRESEKVIVSTIKKYFPEHNFLGEEFKYKKTDSKYKWIIDPIDGTKLFVRGIPYFGTSLGLEKDGKMILGVINMPALNVVAYASKGNAAFVKGKRTKVSKIKKISDAYLLFGDVDKIYSSGYGKPFQKLIQACQGHRGYGDLTGYLFIAQGKADIMIDNNYPWDIAAAKIIIEEAGGKLTDIKGKDTIYSGNSVATNRILHNKIINILS